MSVGRRRKDNPLGLEPRVTLKRNKLWYIHRPDANGKVRWEDLGTDVAKANERARVYNDPNGRYGTLGYFMDRHIADAKAGRLHKKRSPRTIRDNEVEAGWLKTVFDHVTPYELARDPSLITRYRDLRSKDQAPTPENPAGAKGAPVRANRELSYLSTVFAWIIENQLCPGLTLNPVSLVARNPESPKERYVEDHEYNAVYGIAQRSVCMAMTIVYLTLQRPEDVLSLQPGAIRTKSVAGVSKRVLHVEQNKRGRIVDIEITPELEEALAMLTPPREHDTIERIQPYLIHDTGRRKRMKDGRIASPRYTVDGIGAMMRRYCKTASVQTFGLMDVRAKGATDMYLRGVPLEHIQMLMGHKSVTTTEIYIKQLLQTVQIATPNQLKEVG